MGLGLPCDSSVIEPLHSSGQWSRSGIGNGNARNNIGDSVAHISISGGTRLGDSSGIGPATGRYNGKIVTDADILAMIGEDSGEPAPSILYQLMHQDSLYPRYFEHMNASRLKVCFIINLFIKLLLLYTITKNSN